MLHKLMAHMPADIEFQLVEDADDLGGVGSVSAALSTPDTVQKKFARTGVGEPGECVAEQKDVEGITKRGRDKLRVPVNVEGSVRGGS